MFGVRFWDALYASERPQSRTFADHNFKIAHHNIKTHVIPSRHACEGPYDSSESPMPSSGQQLSLS
jgi:hypothetical protein